VTIAWISLWAAALLLLPGWVIWRLGGPRGLPPALEIAPAFALSIAVISLVGWSGYVLGIGFSGVRAVSIVVLALAVLGLPVVLWYRRPTASEPISPPWTLWAAVAIAVGAGLSALYSGPWLSATADAFYHLAAIRSLLEHGTALPQQVFFSAPVPAPDPTSGTWPVALALVSNLSGQDPVMVWRVMTVALPALTVLAFFGLALSITRRGTAALIACALYMVLALSFDFRAAAYPNRFGVLLAWLAVAFVLRFVENGSRRELAVAASIAFAASAVHPLLTPFLLVALAGGVAAAILVCSPSWNRLAVAATIVGAAALPLLVVNVSVLVAPAPYAAMAVTSALPLHTVHHPWTWVWPAFWYYNPGTVLGTAFAVSLVRLWRAGEPRAGLVIATVVAIPAAALTPLFATTHGAQYLLARVAGVLEPLAWVSWGWGLTLAIGALRGRWMVPAAAMLVVSVVAMASAFYIGPWALYVSPANSVRSLASSRSTDLTVAWRDRLAAIDELPRSAILLAEPKMAYELAGLTNIEVVAVPLSHMPNQIEVRDGPRRRADALDAVQGRLDPTSLAGVIEHYGVTDVIVDMDRTDAAAWAQLATAEILSPIASGDRWRLYRYDPAMLDGYLDLPTQEGPGPELARSGVGPQMAVAGRAVFARLQWNQVAAGKARLQADALGSTRTFNRTVEVGGAGSSETLALPIPSDTPVGQYNLRLVLSGGESLPLGRFEVGLLYQAEDMGGVIAGDSSGWTMVGGPAYQGGLAAIATKAGSATHQAIRPADAGSYCVGARIYDYGTNQSNLIEVTLGGAHAQLSWSGSVPGVRWVRTPITLDRAGGQLGIRLIQRGQAAALVDSLEIYPLVAGACSSD
jgi:hypothetical protein